MSQTQKITPFLWFDGNVEEAVSHYLAIFKSGQVISMSRRGSAGSGAVNSATIVIEGQRLILFNGGPHYKFNEAVSMMVSCRTQAEVDGLWEKLTAGGSESRCGWLKDRYGLSWQIVPTRLPELLGDPDPARAQRAMQAMLQMKKLDIATLEAAAAGP